jgi:hypothetical protein
MISMRYHIVSIAAVFLALALGIVLGATKINSPLVVGLQGDKTSLTNERDQLADDNQQLSSRVNSDDAFAGSVGPLVVRGTLPNATVVVLSTADATPADRDAVVDLLGRAGAKVTGELQLTTDFTDPNRSDDLTNLAAQNLPAGAKLPTSGDAGTLVGVFLSSVLITDKAGAAPATATEATAALSALSAGGFVTASGAVAPARSVVIVTGGEIAGSSDGNRAGVVSDLAVALKGKAAGVVVAGRSGSDGANGAVGVIRSDPAAGNSVSTVDDLDNASGRLATVLALVEQNGGGIGRYGLADSAQAQVPTLAVG